MNWSELYTEAVKPALSDVRGFIKSDLYDRLCTFLENEYTIEPKMEYSRCSGQMGWNIKYKKSGKSLCTLYPMDGYFIALVVIGKKEQIETELIMPACTGYVRNLFEKTPFSLGGRWLMVSVTDNDILDDVMKLIAIRRGTKKNSKA